MNKPKYNSYTRDFPMTLDRDTPLPSERTAEADFTAPLPEVDKECYTDSSKDLDAETDFMGLNSSGDCKIDTNKPLTKTVTPDALNLRAEPNGKILFCLKKGDVVTVGEVTDDSEWTHVYTDLGEGWVMSKYLE